MALPSTPADPPSSAASTNTAAAGTARLFTNPPPPATIRDLRPALPHYQPQTHHPTTYSQPQQPLYMAQPLPNLVPRVNPNSNYPQLAAKPQDPTQGILYPVASSGRGFITRPIRPQSADQTVTVANPGGFPPRSVVAAPYPLPHSVRALGFPHSDPHSGQPVHLVRPNHLQHTLLGSTAGMTSGMVKGVPVSSHQKVAPSQSLVSDSNGYKDLRGSNRDDNLVTVRDRKVRICEGSSLYALCRSWLRNGFPEESQPQYVDGLKSLPKPLPARVGNGHSPEKKEDDTEEEEGSAENLSTTDLLQRHIKRAKRVRARLREERLHRIARYKARLALLLPPIMEQQQLRNETAGGN